MEVLDVLTKSTTHPRLRRMHRRDIEISNFLVLYAPINCDAEIPGVGDRPSSGPNHIPGCDLIVQ